ncbi:MAG: succinate dehydrogenase [Proteobacteria bacterium]|nr:succinate dehydrogenase [Pseudomonadota bacterium]
MEARLYLLQRGSAMLLAPLVLIHLGLILYAIGDGLSAAEILGRTRGSFAWAAFYGLFVLAAAVHAPIGLRNLAREWLAWRGRSVDAAALVFGLVLLALGLRAVWAVIGFGIGAGDGA